MDRIGGEAGSSGRRALPCLTKGVLFRGLVGCATCRTGRLVGTARCGKTRSGGANIVGIVSCRRHYTRSIMAATTKAGLRTGQGPLDPDELDRLDAWWRAANYLSVGQIYLLDNPLLREPLRLEHVKPRLLGHWGHHPGAELRLRPPEPGHRPRGPGRHLRDRAWARRPGAGGQCLPGGDLLRGLSPHRR